MRTPSVQFFTSLWLRQPGAPVPRLRLYLGLVLLIALAPASIFFNEYSFLPTFILFLASVYAIAIGAYLTYCTVRAKGLAEFLNMEIFGDGRHPMHGLLAARATSRQGKLLYWAFYPIAIAGMAWLMTSDHDPDGTYRGLAALCLILLFAILPAELLAVIVARRWGSTPPRHVATGFLLISSVFGFMNGVFVSVACIDYLQSTAQFEPEWELLRLVPVASTFLQIAGHWFRDITVSLWQSKVLEQANRTQEAERGRQLAEAKMSVMQAQLAMMQAQIEPHFLYNTLASVQYLVRKDSTAADFLLTQLIRYLRHAMPKMRQPMSTLQQEFELADAFLQIARMRMAGRLTVDVELAQSLNDVSFPPLVLQTLVENALKHGVEPKIGPVHVCVSARLVGDTLFIDVLDNGVGLGRAATAGSGAGLASIRQRLAGIYVHRAQLSIADVPTGGVKSTVRLSGVVLPFAMPEQDLLETLA